MSNTPPPKDPLDEILKDFLDETDYVLEAPEEQADDSEWFDRPYKQAKQQILTHYISYEEVERLIPEKKELPLSEPSLRQGSGGDSAPFFCELCGMSEMILMERKEDDRYYCHCSYWSDPHNAYLDKSGGNWLGWFDRDAARKTIDGMPLEENGYNQAIAELKAALKKRREYK